MRLPALVRFAAGGLWRHKGRTLLTVLGVAVGAGGVAFSLSLGFGLRAYIDREFHRRQHFWTVHVQPGRGTPVAEADIPPDQIAVPGDMSPERRARLRALKVEQYQGQHRTGPPAKLTPDRLGELAALPGVERVEAWHSHYGEVRAGTDRKKGTGQIVAGPLATLEPRLVAGRLPADAADEVAVSERLLYALGFEDDAALTATLGKPLRLTFGGPPAKGAGLSVALGLATGDLTGLQEQVLGRAAAALPKAIDSLDLTPEERQLFGRMLADATAKKPADKYALAEPVSAAPVLVGVVRDLPTTERYAADNPDPWEMRTADVFLPSAAGNHLFGRLPWVQERGYDSARVRVTPGGDLRATVAGVEAAGFDCQHLLKFYDATRTQVTLTAAGLNLFALLALVVACLGITNTLVTSVVERTREIGMMKAVGAAAGQVRGLFLAEGAVIGLLGGVLGLAGAMALTGPADRLVHVLIERSTVEKLEPGTVFLFPAWLAVATVGFAAGVTTLAAWYPARRAARLDPVADNPRTLSRPSAGGSPRRRRLGGLR